MSLLEEWQKLVTTSLKGQDFQFSKTLRDGTEVQPLYLQGSESLKLQAPAGSYCNISSSMDLVNTKDSCSGLFCSKIDQLKSLSGGGALYLSSSLWPSVDNIAVVESQLDKWSSINLGWDLWTKALHEGRLRRFNEDQFSLKASKLLDHKKVTLFRFSSESYHLAGAHHIHELAILLSTALEVLKKYTGEVELQDLVAKMSFEFVLGTDPFQNIAKLQAFQLLWQKFQQSLEIQECETSVYARPSLRYLSSREPWNNIMRMTLMNFSAQLGGARGFFHQPYDCYSAQPKDDGHVARNISLILDKESSLLSSDFPALGSGYVDSMTEQYSEKAWSFFQEIQNKGGLLESLLSGWLQREITLSHADEVKSLMDGEKKVIGVNHFAGMTNLSEQYKFINESKKIEDLWEERVGQIDRSKANEIQPLRPVQLSSLFEQWQRKSDAYLVSNGVRPRVSIYCQDSKAFKERLQWLKNLLNSGGIQSQMTKAGEDPAADIVLCLGYDPDEKDWSDRLQLWQKNKGKTIFWFGEKENSNFKNRIHKKSNPMEFYEKAYRIFSEGL